MSAEEVILSQHYTEGHPIWIDYEDERSGSKVRYYPERRCENKHDRFSGFRCSVCGVSYPKIVDDRGFLIATLYCPSCGARWV